MFIEEKDSVVHNLSEQVLNVVQKLKIRDRECDDERMVEYTQSAPWFWEKESKLKCLLNKE